MKNNFFSGLPKKLCPDSRLTNIIGEVAIDTQSPIRKEAELRTGISGPGQGTGA